MNTGLMIGLTIAAIVVMIVGPFAYIIWSDVRYDRRVERERRELLERLR